MFLLGKMGLKIIYIFCVVGKITPKSSKTPRSRKTRGEGDGSKVLLVSHRLLPTKTPAKSSEAVPGLPSKSLTPTNLQEAGILQEPVYLPPPILLLSH